MFHKRIPSGCKTFDIIDCAQDERIFKALGIEFNLLCRDNGNYESIQDQNGKMFCVDRDGYAVSPILSPDSGLDCDQFLYYAQEDLFLDDDADDDDAW